MQKHGIFNIDINDVSSTMLLTLYCHARESRSADPIIDDPRAVEITAALNRQLAGSADRMYRDLADGKLNKKLITFITLRARQFDRYTQDFLSSRPDGSVVNLGCGLDTRFWRVDNGSARFYDLDLPGVIKIKRKLMSETDRYRMIASSVLDFRWMDLLKQHGSSPCLFLAEGLLMYLEKDSVRDLLLKLQTEFPGSELVCEVVHESVVNGWLKGAMNLRMQGELHLGQEATFVSGVRDGHEMESWSPGINLLSEWSHFDSDEKKLGWARLFGKIPGMRRVQWTVHYRLG
ncbi:MAG: class I SAM-dependent methyltransferase [Dehalococcoidia bacterium]|nr:class I SAM-dependent methyltransferase [Dehalococcoidia bacterium]